MGAPAFVCEAEQDSADLQELADAKIRAGVTPPLTVSFHGGW
ncbi:hypothetical protein [Erwinia sorbitola]|nr:hypothetical protein [Erwinia sorbitola]